MRLSAFVVRDFYIETSYRLSFLVTVGGILLRVFIFFFLAQFIGTVPQLAQYGGDYFAFVLVGLALGSYFGAGLTGFANALRQAQVTGTLEAMVMTPTPLSLLVVGSAAWSYLLTTLRVLIYLLVGLLLGVNLQGGNGTAALLILVLSIIAFASLGIIAASLMMVIKRGDPLTGLIANLASLVGGVFYPVEILPDWLQRIASLIPLTYAARALRLALLQDASWAELTADILALLTFCLLLLPLSLWLFQIAVRQARIAGTLTHY